MSIISALQERFDDLSTPNKDNVRLILWGTILGLVVGLITGLACHSAGLGFVAGSATFLGITLGGKQLVMAVRIFLDYQKDKKKEEER